MSSSVLASAPQPASLDTSEDLHDVQRTTCCIVGGGPGGAVLALLLAREGVPVILLEAHDDFDRDFRGDTIHPSVMEIMDELGLAERLLQLPHAKIHTGMIMTGDGPVTIADFRHLKTRFPYITMLPQARFLEFITNEARRYPNFHVLMGARVEELIEEDEEVRGARYRCDDGWHEIRALLTVGADGRSSRIRQLAGIESIKTAPPMDILWFRLPRTEGDPAGALARFGRGHMLVMLDRSREWQVGYVIPKGSYQQIREDGIESLQRTVAEMVPEFIDRVDHLKEWKQVSMLSVESSRITRWYRPGLLLIGDAAHVMSPVGGVGINYAIQDAVVAANVLGIPLKAGRLQLGDLAAVQDQREWPTRIIQAIQGLIQRRVITNALDPNQPFRVPAVFRLFLRVPFLRDLPARVIAFGIWPVHLKNPSSVRHI